MSGCTERRSISGLCNACIDDSCELLELPYARHSGPGMLLRIRLEVFFMIASEILELLLAKSVC